MTNFPSSLDSTGSTLPTVATGTDNLNASGNKRHDTKHDMEDGAIIAVETKIGTGASTPTSQTLLYGTGSGTSAWTTANLGAWTDFTPSLTQSGSVTFTTVQSSYAKVGRIAHIFMVLQITGSGTANNPIAIGSVPAAIAPAQTAMFGSALVVHSATGYYVGVPVFANSTTFNMVVHNALLNSLVGQTPNFGLANGDFIQVDAVYLTSS